MDNTGEANQTTKDLACDLDSETGAINTRIITLNDVRTLMSYLRIDMDNVDENNIRLAFRDYHMKVRIMDDLLIYSLEKLNKDFERLYEINQKLFEKLVGQSE